MSRVEAQPHDCEQYLLLNSQSKGVSTTYGSETVRSFISQPLVLCSRQQRADILHELLQRDWSQFSQGVERVRMKL